jgi:hypothetical protein
MTLKCFNSLIFATKLLVHVQILPTSYGSSCHLQQLTTNLLHILTLRLSVCKQALFSRLYSPLAQGLALRETSWCRIQCFGCVAQMHNACRAKTCYHNNDYKLIVSKRRLLDTVTWQSWLCCRWSSIVRLDLWHFRSSF